MDLFTDADSLDEAVTTLLGQLERQHGAKVRLIAGDARWPAAC
jgi:hypothetical protein